MGWGTIFSTLTSDLAANQQKEKKQIDTQPVEEQALQFMVSARDKICPAVLHVETPGDFFVSNLQGVYWMIHANFG